MRNASAFHIEPAKVMYSQCDPFGVLFHGLLIWPIAQDIGIDIFNFFLMFCNRILFLYNLRGRSFLVPVKSNIFLIFLPYCPNGCGALPNSHLNLSLRTTLGMGPGSCLFQ